MIHDLKHALKVLLRSPMYLAVSLITVAVGIAANAAIFSVTNALLLRPLPFRDPDRLVSLWVTNPRFQVGFTNLPASDGDFTDWRAQNTVFERMSVLVSAHQTMTGGPEPERLSGALVSHDFFETMGVDLQLGRTFL